MDAVRGIMLGSHGCTWGEFLKTYCTLNIIPGDEYEFFLLSYLFGFSWFYRDCLMLESLTSGAVSLDRHTTFRYLDDRRRRFLVIKSKSPRIIFLWKMFGSV